MLSGRHQPERFFPRSTMNIQPIGHGEVSSLPILLRRLRDKAQAWRWRSRNRIGTHDRNSRSGIRVAAQTHDRAGILALSDADNVCPLTPNLDCGHATRRTRYPASPSWRFGG